jgi:histidyl-tRNA synthetase
LNQLNLFNDISVSSTEVLVVNFGENETSYAINILNLLRDLNVRSEFYPDAAKLKKQIAYADSKKIPYIVIAGEDEINKNSITIKKMSSGEQKKISLSELSVFVEEIKSSN